MSFRHKLLLSFLASFVVYLIPVVGPHTFAFMGEVFFQSQPLRPAWRATNMGVGLLFQGVAFAVFYWFFRKPVFLRGILVGLTAIALLVSGEYLFLFAIPALFLIEGDTRSETGNWPVECSADDAYIASVPMPERTSSEPIPEVLVQMSKGTYGTMSIPRCAVKPIAVPEPAVQQNGHVNFMLAIDYFVPGRALLFNTFEPQTRRQTWSVLRSGAGAIIDDAVYVLRANDGVEIFRRYLPRYTRTPVLFPTNEYFLYSSGSMTHLLRITR